MKRFYTLMTVVAIAMLSFTFTACDDDDYIADTLWGTWEGDMYVTSHWNNRYYDATYTEISFDRDPDRYASGTGYWVDYYSNAPWDYIANHIRWTVRNGNIEVYFVEDRYDMEIYDFTLSRNYFDGYIYTDDDKRVEFHLRKTASPDWDRYHWGSSYWGDDYYYYGKSTRGAGDTLTVEQPKRMFMKR